MSGRVHFLAPHHRLAIPVRRFRQQVLCPSRSLEPPRYRAVVAGRSPELRGQHRHSAGTTEQAESPKLSGLPSRTLRHSAADSPRLQPGRDFRVQLRERYSHPREPADRFLESRSRPRRCNPRDNWAFESATASSRTSRRGKTARATTPARSPRRLPPVTSLGSGLEQSDWKGHSPSLQGYPQRKSTVNGSSASSFPAAAS